MKWKSGTKNHYKIPYRIQSQHQDIFHIERCWYTLQVLTGYTL